MKPAFVALLVLIAAALIVFIRAAGIDAPLVQVLPFLGGHEPGLYDVAGVIMLLITAWGVRRLVRRSNNNR